MNRRQWWLGVGLMWVACAIAVDAAELKRYDLDSLDGVVTRTGVALDPAVSSDGRGSLKITAAEPVTVRLFEAGDLDVERVMLIYQARVRSEDLHGQAYVEMLCHFPNSGESFSKGLNQAVKGTANWKTVETPFFLKAGENPDNIKLNLVIQGRGTVWVDSVRLETRPLPVQMSMPFTEGKSRPWFDPNHYAWMPGTLLGVFGGLLGSLVGLVAWRGKGQALILGLERSFFLVSAALLAAGAIALVSDQPYGIWYGLGLPGVMGVVMTAWMLPLTKNVYRQAEQRRLAAKDL